MGGVIVSPVEVDSYYRCDLPCFISMTSILSFKCIQRGGMESCRRDGSVVRGAIALLEDRVQFPTLTVLLTTLQTPEEGCPFLTSMGTRHTPHTCISAIQTHAHKQIVKLVF